MRDSKQILDRMSREVFWYWGLAMLIDGSEEDRLHALDQLIEIWFEWDQGPDSWKPRVTAKRRK